GQVQMARVGDVGIEGGRGGEAAAGGVAPEVDDLRVAAIGVALQLEAGRCVRVDAHRADVDPGRGQLGEGEPAERVVADPSDPAGAVTESGQPGGDVGLGAGQRPGERGDPLE